MSLLDDRIAAPTHRGRLEAPTGTGEVGNPACGDILTVTLQVDGARISRIAFDSFGSVYQAATGSLLCEAVEGTTVVEARALDAEAILERVPDLPARHRYLARLAVDALRAALDDATTRHAEPSADDDVEAFVVGFIQSAGPVSTTAIHDALEGSGRRCPRLLRLLARLREEEVVRGELDPDAGAWQWWV